MDEKFSKDLQVNTDTLYKDVKEQIMKEFRENYQVIRENLLEDLRKELKISPLPSKDNFFTKNPLITFAIFSIVVILLFKAFVGNG